MNTMRLSHGVQIGSRHDNPSEWRQLEAFTEGLHQAQLSSLVRVAWYESNSCHCILTLRTGLDFYDPQAAPVKAVAERTLLQYDWGGQMLGRGTD